jgi:hypothetical protein
MTEETKAVYPMTLRDMRAYLKQSDCASQESQEKRKGKHNWYANSEGLYCKACGLRIWHGGLAK